MKKIMRFLFYIFVVMSCTACATAFEPKKVTIDGVVYRRGFYDDSQLYPMEITFREESYWVNDKEYRRVNYEQFDYVHKKGGGTTAGLLFCAETQWEEAQAYYADSKNYLYYCKRGVKDNTRVPVVTAVPDMEAKKLDALMAFAEKSGHKPFGANNVKTRRLPIPDKDESPVLFFYKESKDGFFTSNRGHRFYIDQGKLVLLFYYDYGHGKYKEMLVVDVPDKLSQYFVKLVKQMNQEE